MELEAMEAAAVYRKLAGQFSGRGREQLRASARYADGDSRLSAGDRAAVRQWGQKNSADRRSGGAGSEGAGKAVSLRPACSDGVHSADGGRGFRHCVPAPCGFEPGGVRSAGPSAGGTGAEHFTIIGKKTKPGHDPPQGSHVPFFSILNVPDLCQVADMHARRDRKFRGIAVSFVRKGEYVRHSTGSEGFQRHPVHCLGVNPVVPDESAQHLSQRPFLVVASEKNLILQKIPLPLQQGKPRSLHSAMVPLLSA